MDGPMLPPPPPPPEGSTPRRVPWEDPSSGLARGLLETVKLFVLSPKEGFLRMGTAGIWRPFFYAVIMAWVELLVGLGYWFAFQAPFFVAGTSRFQEGFPGIAVGAWIVALFALGLFIAMPVLVAIFIFLHALILHLALLIVGEGRGGVETTFRLLCYAHTADLGNIVPFCGGLLSLVWFVVLQVIGVAEAHRCSYGKATLAVLLPLLVCCACVAVVLALGVGTAILGSLFHHP